MYSSFNIHIGSWFKCKSIFRGFQFSTSYLFCFLQPLGQYWFQFACILEAQLQVFKPANSSLAEFRAMHCSQCFSDVSLRVTCKKWRKKKLLSIRCLALHCWVYELCVPAVSSGWTFCRGLCDQVWAHLRENFSLLLVSLEVFTDLMALHSNIRDLRRNQTPCIFLSISAAKATG